MTGENGCKLSTVDSQSSEPFFAQVNHLFFLNKRTPLANKPSTISAVTFEPVIKLIPNFQCEKICRIDVLLDKVV